MGPGEAALPGSPTLRGTAASPRSSRVRPRQLKLSALSNERTSFATAPRSLLSSNLGKTWWRVNECTTCPSVERSDRLHSRGEVIWADCARQAPIQPGSDPPVRTRSLYLTFPGSNQRWLPEPPARYSAADTLWPITEPEPWLKLAAPPGVQARRQAPEPPAPGFESESPGGAPQSGGGAPNASSERYSHTQEDAMSSLPHRDRASIAGHRPVTSRLRSMPCACVPL